MKTLKKWAWDVQPWQQKVAFVIMVASCLILSVIGWIDIFGG